MLTKSKILYALIAFSLSNSTLCANLVGGDAASPRTSLQQIQTSTFDTGDGTFYVGKATGAGAGSLAKALRGTTTLVNIGSDALVNSKSIALLTHGKNNGGAAPYLVAIDGAVPNRLVTLTTDGATAVQTNADINDANGDVTTKIVALAASSTHIFAAVEPNGTLPFGQANGGIALIKVTPGTLVQDALNAVTGASDGNQARVIDNTVANTPTVAIQNNVPILFFPVDLFYDEQLDCLYIGLWSLIIGQSGDGARSVVVGEVNGSDQLVLKEIIPAALVGVDPIDNIVAGKLNAQAQLTSTFKVHVMHASTGPSYLIINGGSTCTSSDTPRRCIYALPLIDSPGNPEHGTIAKKDAALVGNKFVTTPTVTADLPVASDAAASIGQGMMPTHSSVEVTGITSVSDTVYVSVNTTKDSSTENGIWSSTAQFDGGGKINGWTAWTQLSESTNPFPASNFDTNDQGRIAAFAIDESNNNIWIIDGVEQQSIDATILT